MGNTFSSFSWLALIACNLMMGCSGSQSANYPTVSIHGTVKLGGEKLKDGEILYFPTGTGMGSGGKSKVVDGEYSISDLARGRNTFMFSALIESGKMIPGPSGSMERERVNIIPEKYRNSGITREISEDGNQEFELSKK